MGWRSACWLKHVLAQAVRYQEIETSWFHIATWPLYLILEQTLWPFCENFHSFLKYSLGNCSMLPPVLKYWEFNSKPTLPLWTIYTDHLMTCHVCSASYWSSVTFIIWCFCLVLFTGSSGTFLVFLIRHVKWEGKTGFIDADGKLDHTRWWWWFFGGLHHDHCWIHHTTVGLSF